MQWFRVLAAIVLVGLLVALGAGVYQAGVVAGAAQQGTATVAPWMYGWGPGFGFGFGIFHLLGTLFFLFLVFALIRVVLFGGSRRRWGGPGGGWNHDAGPMGPRGPWGPGRDAWEERIREYHATLHASEAAGRSTPDPSAAPGSTAGPGAGSGPTA